MAFGAQHARDAEGGELLAGIVDALDLEPDARQRLDDRIERRVGIEMLLEPAQREFHIKRPVSPAQAGFSMISRAPRRKETRRRGGAEMSRFRLATRPCNVRAVSMARSRSTQTGPSAPPRLRVNISLLLRAALRIACGGWQEITPHPRRSA